MLRNIVAGQGWEPGGDLGGSAVNGRHKDEEQDLPSDFALRSAADAQQFAYDFIRSEKLILRELRISQPQQKVVVTGEGRQDGTLQDQSPITARGMFILEFAEERLFQFTNRARTAG